MDFFDSVLTIGGSILSGGLTGLIGTGLSLVGDHYKRKQDLEMKKLENDHELNVMQHEWDGRVRVAQIEGEAEVEVEDAKGFATSYKLLPQRMLDIDGKDMPWIVKVLLGFVDFWRALIRPAMTTYLVVLTTLIYLHLKELMGKYTSVLQQSTVEDTFILIISTVLYLTTTCVLWWFGTRNKNKPPKTA